MRCLCQQFSEYSSPKCGKMILNGYVSHEIHFLPGNNSEYAGGGREDDVSGRAIDNSASGNRGCGMDDNNPRDVEAIVVSSSPGKSGAVGATDDGSGKLLQSIMQGSIWYSDLWTGLPGMMTAAPGCTSEWSGLRGVVAGVLCNTSEWSLRTHTQRHILKVE